MSRILVAEDNDGLRRLIELVLIADDHEVFIATDGEKALSLLDDQRPHLLITDLKMPKMDGWDLIRRVRQSERHGWVPILAVSAYPDLENRKMSFEAGANDFIIKPIDPDDLLMRVRAQIRRDEESTYKRLPGQLQLGPFWLKSSSMEAAFNGAALDLTKSEFMVLAILIMDAPDIVPVDQLLERGLGYPPGAGHATTLRMAIAKLRDKIGDSSENPRYLLNVPGLGYRLEGS